MDKIVAFLKVKIIRSQKTIGDIGISAKDINNINVPSGQLRVVNLVKRRRKKRKMCSLKLGRISYLGVPCGIHL